jgi:hypothetical protein
VVRVANLFWFAKPQLAGGQRVYGENLTAAPAVPAPAGRQAC